MIIPFPTSHFPKKSLPTVRQSNIITTATYDFNVYEKRIFYNIVKNAQKEISNSGTFTETDSNVQMAIRIKDCLLGNGDKNHTRIKQALDSLSEKEITCKIDDEYRSFPVLYNPRFDENSCSLIFVVDRHIWNVIKDPCLGYSEYEYEQAFHLESVYSMRMYEIMSSLCAPLILSIDGIREIFNLQNKYDRTKDLIQKVIDSAQNELDVKSPVTFTYKKITTGKKITSLKFYAVRKRK